MKSSTVAALALALGLSSLGAAHAAVNPNAFTGNTTTGSGSNGIAPVVAVPEPASWALMLVGAAVIGFSLRGRRLARKV